jgi:hypothetical protein
MLELQGVSVEMSEMASTMLYMSRVHLVYAGLIQVSCFAGCHRIFALRGEDVGSTNIEVTMLCSNQLRESL